MTWTDDIKRPSLRLPRILSACILLTASLCKSAQAQAPSGFEHNAEVMHVTIRLEKPALLDVLKELNRQTGLSIMADGVAKPFTDTMRLDGNLKYVLDKVALTFGYSWRASGDRTVIFRKSFKDTDDLPQTNLPEWQRMAQDIHLILQKACSRNNDVNLFQQADRFYSSLSQDQRDTLSTGAYLMGTSLTEAQRASVWQLCMESRFARPLAQWNAMDLFLTYLPSGYLQLDSSVGSPPASNAGAVQRSKMAVDALTFIVKSPAASTAPILIWKDRQKGEQMPDPADKGAKP